MEQKQQKKTQEGEDNLQSKAALRCKYCGCDTKEDVIKTALWTNMGLIVIEDIPAWLCDGCGEQFFEEEITRKIRLAVTYPVAKAKRRIQVPVYSLSQVGAARKERHSERIRANQDRQETLLCKYCESETVEDLVKSALWVDGGLVAAENIPARVCRRCRQQFYDDETAEKITTLEKRKFAVGTARRHVSVPVFSLADVEQSSGKSHHQEKSDSLEQMPPPISKATNQRAKDNG